MSDYRYCAGSFSRPSASGFQTVPVSDLCGSFTPKAVIFYSANSVAHNAFQSTGYFTLGWTDGDFMCSTTTYKGNGDILGPGTHAYMTSLFCISYANSSPTGIHEVATIANFDHGSFTLTWVIDNPPEAAVRVNFLAIGGDDVTCVAGRTFTPEALGSQVVSVPGAGVITGLFTMNVLTMLDASTGVAGPWCDNIPGIGWSGGTHQGVFSTHVNDPRTFTQATFKAASTTAVVNNFGESTDSSITAKASLTSLGTNQFTLSWSESNFPGFFGDAMNPTYIGNTGTYFLTIAGPQVYAGSALQPSVSGPQALATPFTPGAAMFASIGAPATPTPIADATFSMGTSDGSNQASTWISSISDAEPAVAACGQFENRVLTMATAAADAADVTVQGVASNNLFQLAGLNLTWSGLSGAPDQFQFIAFEAGRNGGGMFCSNITQIQPTPGTTTFQIRRLRQSPHISDEGERLRHKRLQIDMQTGIGRVSGPITETDPHVIVQWSDDGGATWTHERVLSAGLVGQYRRRVQLYRLGEARDRVYRLIVTDPVLPWSIVDAYIDIDRERS